MSKRPNCADDVSGKQEMRIWFEGLHVLILPLLI